MVKSEMGPPNTRTGVLATQSMSNEADTCRRFVVPRLQAATVAELDALLPSILDKAFKGEM